ncbi:sulfite oxidase heme-binding subunit YedZ [Hyphobacterium marinum]|uniref:Protein-methionine-sulfoxide reductase heme-binding subunit MsrQ n=1 Tax=Hyphobacterium marinum TaxID=3116574 RepID=A0ABU7LW16_9PROT|nr:protein-methionine-sulfoxide reductase heme-binding subunit MsrQ [Hyphobacterium sp. Y6023]MEE2565170.1 protein-methionine-sulfoxide reductase heme-binding subunit MsrQ [Hyphobacterium sp. Y6023]
MADRKAILRSFAKHWLKPLVLIALVLPLVWITVQWVLLLTGQPNDLGFEPVAATHHFLGQTAIRILLISLAITPFRDLTKWGPVMKVRRRIGLAAFWYALLHLTAYFGADLFFSLPKLWEDIVERTYITFGMAALALLIPLAVTSFDSMIRRLGALRWKRLHMLVYPIAILAVTHHFFAEKGLQPGPLVHAGILALLLGYRVWKAVETRANRPASA